MEVFETQHLLIKGRVQGVSFRYFTKTQAEAHGIFGWVRNLTDGRVEALVQGHPAKIESLMMAVRRGPARAQVQEVLQRTVATTERYNSFEIIEDSKNTWSA